MTYAKKLPAQELLEKKITVRMEDKSIKTILNQIESESKVQFVYSSSAIEANRKTSINLQNQSLKVALDMFLSPLQINYRVTGNKIILSYQPPIPPSEEKNNENKNEASIDDNIVKGTVTDSKGQTLPGVSVVIKGSTKGTTTNSDGMFSIVAKPSETLVFSYVGFVKKELAVGNQTEVNITLVEDTQTLGEVVVTALGIKRDKRALGYSVQEITGESVSLAKEANVANSLAGKMAGVQVTRSSGGAGGSAKVVIRGNNSLVGNSQPL